MSLGEKYCFIYKGLMKTVRKANEAGVLMQHPEWNDEKVEKDLDLNLNPVDYLLIQLCLKTYVINILR